MLDWVSGKPTAAYWVLKLLVEEFGNREKRLYPTTSTVPESVECGGPARETGPVNASCGDSTVTAVDFFSYGTPEGSCRLGNLSIGTCNAARNLTGFVAQVIPPLLSLFTLLRPYLAHFFPVLCRFLRVFTAWPRRFQRAPSRNPGPRNSRHEGQEGRTPPSFDAVVTIF